MILRLLPTRVDPSLFQRVCKCLVTVHTATASVQWDAHSIFWCVSFKTVVYIQLNFSTLFMEHNFEAPSRFLGDFSQLKEKKTEKKITLKAEDLRRSV